MGVAGAVEHRVDARAGPPGCPGQPGRRGFRRARRTARVQHPQRDTCPPATRRPRASADEARRPPLTGRGRRQNRLPPPPMAGEARHPVAGQLTVNKSDLGPPAAARAAPASRWPVPSWKRTPDSVSTSNAPIIPASRHARADAQDGPRRRAAAKREERVAAPGGDASLRIRPRRRRQTASAGLQRRRSATETSAPAARAAGGGSLQAFRAAAGAIRREHHKDPAGGGTAPPPSGPDRSSSVGQCQSGAGTSRPLQSLPRPTGPGTVELFADPVVGQHHVAPQHLGEQQLAARRGRQPTRRQAARETRASATARAGSKTCPGRHGSKTTAIRAC